LIIRALPLVFPQTLVQEAVFTPFAVLVICNPTLVLFVREDENQNFFSFLFLLATFIFFKLLRQLFFSPQFAVVIHCGIFKP